VSYLGNIFSLSQHRPGFGCGGLFVPQMGIKDGIVLGHLLQLKQGQSGLPVSSSPAWHLLFAAVTAACSFWPVRSQAATSCSSAPPASPLMADPGHQPLARWCWVHVGCPILLAENRLRRPYSPGPPLDTPRAPPNRMALQRPSYWPVLPACGPVRS
jgi:hypothetical protein